RTGIDSVGSLLRSAAAITTSATPTSFFSTGPGGFVFACAMVVLSLPRPAGLGVFGCRDAARGGLRLAFPGRLQPLFGWRVRLCGIVRRGARRLALGCLGRDDDRVWQTVGTAIATQDLVGPGPARPLHRDLLQLAPQLVLGQLAALQARAR